jgi:hypothetical protein
MSQDYLPFNICHFRRKLRVLNALVIFWWSSLVFDFETFESCDFFILVNLTVTGLDKIKVLTPPPLWTNHGIKKLEE